MAAWLGWYSLHVGHVLSKRRACSRARVTHISDVLARMLTHLFLHAAGRTQSRSLSREETSVGKSGDSQVGISIKNAEVPFFSYGERVQQHEAR